MDENRIGQKQDWTKSFGPKPVGRKGVGRKLGARYFTYVICNLMLSSTAIQNTQKKSRMVYLDLFY